eukprot:CAMPEP_0118940344 /NCGR_PEP_ID=MMETSP1169-20130426/31246_1 /TAXON_ID=36882 /ORGANISM="Pyramimonas obovata, Strain CCMP722" /LENGTH=47 /DNA_ID= /DNA_START= /DNA_END= /DNA_ORIENTATION=
MPRQSRKRKESPSVQQKDEEGLSAYELERKSNIERNKKRMKEMGVEA